MQTTPEPVHKRAASVKVLFCNDWDQCARPHVVLFDTEGHIIADFVLPDPHEDGGGFLNDLNRASARSLLIRGKLASL